MKHYFGVEVFLSTVIMKSPKSAPLCITEYWQNKSNLPREKRSDDTGRCRCSFLEMLHHLAHPANSRFHQGLAVPWRVGTSY